MPHLIAFFLSSMASEQKGARIMVHVKQSMVDDKWLVINKGFDCSWWYVYFEDILVNYTFAYPFLFCNSVLASCWVSWKKPSIDSVVRILIVYVSWDFNFGSSGEWFQRSIPKSREKHSTKFSGNGSRFWKALKHFRKQTFLISVLLILLNV